MSSSIYRDIQLKRQRSAQQFEGRKERWLAQLVRFEGNLRVPGRPGYVYAQQLPIDDAPPPVPVLCVGVQARETLRVWIEKNLEGEWEVVDWWRGITQQGDYNLQAYLPLHAHDHEWPDRSPHADAVSVYPRALAMLRAYPGEAGGLTISISPLRYMVDGAVVLYPGELSLDVSASQPAAGNALYLGVYLDLATNTIQTISGPTTVDAGPIEPASPSFPDNVLTSAMVRFDGSATTFYEADFVDLRVLIGQADTGGGGELARAVVFEGNVITNDEEIVYI